MGCLAFLILTLLLSMLWLAFLCLYSSSTLISLTSIITASVSIDNFILTLVTICLTLFSCPLRKLIYIIPTYGFLNFGKLEVIKLKSFVPPITIVILAFFVTSLFAIIKIFLVLYFEYQLSTPHIPLLFSLSFYDALPRPLVEIISIISLAFFRILQIPLHTLLIVPDLLLAQLNHRLH